MSCSPRSPLARARAKCEHLERELRKSPDFHLYLLTRSPKDRARMERVLLQLPDFRLWHVLSASIRRAEARARRCAVAALRHFDVPAPETGVGAAGDFAG